MNNKQFAIRRNKWRSDLLKDGKRAYSKREYIRRIKVHHETLKKYVNQFHQFLSKYVIHNITNHKKLAGVLGESRLVEIAYEQNPPTINEILKIFIKMRLKGEFIHYLIMKTHLSYSINDTPIKCERLKFTFDRKGMYTKFAEFIYLILAEYIILHNYMFVSGLKPKEIKSIDIFLKNIK